MKNFKGGVEIKVLLFSVHHNGVFCVAQGLAVSTDHWPYISNTLGTLALERWSLLQNTFKNLLVFFFFFFYTYSVMSVLSNFDFLLE